MPVAVVVKAFLLVHAAAPDPQHVAADVRDQGQGAGVPVAVQAVVGAQRHPVAAPAEHVHAVDLELELQLFRLLALLEADLAQADVQLPPRDDGLAVQQLRHRVVDVGLAVAVGPPELGIFHRAGDAPDLGPIQRALPEEGGIRAAAPGDAHGEALPRELFQRRIHAEVEFQAGRLHAVEADAVAQLRKGVRVAHGQAHALPQPGRHRPREDVPAKGMGGLAQRRAAVDVPAGQQVLRIGLGELFQQSGADVYPEDVLRPQPVSHVELVGHEGVFGRADPLAVEEVFRQAVDPVQAEKHALVRRGLGRGKLPRIPPAKGLERFGLSGVHSLEQVLGQYPRPGQVQLHVSRHLRRDAGRAQRQKLRRRPGRLPPFVRKIEGPGSVQ